MRILSWHSVIKAVFITGPGYHLSRGYHTLHGRLYGIREAYRAHFHASISGGSLSIDPGSALISKRWLEVYRSGRYRDDGARFSSAHHAPYDERPPSSGRDRGSHRGAGLVTAAPRKPSQSFKKPNVNEHRTIASPSHPTEEANPLFIPSTQSYSYGQKVVARIAYFNDKGAVVSVDDGERNGFIPKLDVLFYQDLEGVNLARGDEVTAYVGRQSASSSGNSSHNNVEVHGGIAGSNQRSPNANTRGDVKGALAIGKSPKDSSLGPVDVRKAGAAETSSGVNFLVLHLRKVGGEGRDDAAASIMSALETSADGSIPIGDKSNPDAIYDMFKGMSKKLFKDALGRLFKQGLVVPTDNAVFLKSKHPNMITRHQNASVTSPNTPERVSRNTK